LERPRNQSNEEVHAGWLIPLLFPPLSSQFNADAAVYEIVGRSRKPQEFVNGYDDIIIAIREVATRERLLSPPIGWK
jgi:hypothetical protein